MAMDGDARASEMLAELSELALELARDLQAQALAATDASEKTELALAFQRTARAVRQSLALKARFARESDRSQREALAEARRSLQVATEAEDRAARIEAAATPRRRLRDSVERAVQRCIAAEHDDCDAERLDEELGDLLDADMARGDFLDHPADAHVRRLCADLDVDPPRPRTPWPDRPRPERTAEAAGSAPDLIPDGRRPIRDPGAPNAEPAARGSRLSAPLRPG